MANKTSNSKPPQDQPVKIQSQLARVKKEEEEEELWISGEELYTEGSSDEEECKTQSRSRRRINNNQSSRVLSINPCDDRRGPAHICPEIRGKSENPGDVTKNKKINEGPFVSINMQKSTKLPLLSGKSSNSSLTEPRSAQTSSMTKLQMTANLKELNRKEDSLFGTFSCDETENGEISWKAKRALTQYVQHVQIKEQSSMIFNETVIALRDLRAKYDRESQRDEREFSCSSSSCNEEEFFAIESQEDTADSIEDSKEEWERNQVSKIQILDSTIRKFYDKVKRATEETLSYQCENRKRLEALLSASSPETGKLAENTRRFFELCPKYTMRDAGNAKGDEKSKKTERNEDNISNISPELNEEKHDNYMNLAKDDDEELSSCDMDSHYTYEREGLNVNDLENLDVLDKILDSDSNSFSADTEIKQMLNELNERVLDHRKDLCNDKEQPVANSVFNINNTASTVSVSTIKSLHDVNAELVDEVLKEAQITKPLSILTVAEDNTEEPQ